MRLPRDAWQLSLLLPIAARSRSASPSRLEGGIVHIPPGGGRAALNEVALRRRSRAQVGMGGEARERGHAVAGITEGHATPCPF
jgi:hypothetical protein